MLVLVFCYALPLRAAGISNALLAYLKFPRQEFKGILHMVHPREGVDSERFVLGIGWGIGWNLLLEVGNSNVEL